MAKQKYDFKVRKCYKGTMSEESAVIYGKELTKIQDKYGDIHAEHVVDEARKKNSPLHDWFDWDDKTAGEAYRREQARLLIRVIAIEVIINDEPEEVRFWYNVKTKSKSESSDGESSEIISNQRYVNIDQVQSDEELRQQVIEQALAELLSWKERYKIYRELFGIFGAINKLKRKFGEK